MILNVQPTLMRIATVPKDSPMLDPNEMAGWWMVGRAERTQPVDSANVGSKALAVRGARPRWWSRLRRTGKGQGRRHPKRTQLRSRIPGSEIVNETLT
jgi:hypothetical protein